MSIYSSFLIRCWTHRDGAEAKFVVEHVQSGQQFRANQICDACAWIEKLSDQPQQEDTQDDRERT